MAGCKEQENYIRITLLVKKIIAPSIAQLLMNAYPNLSFQGILNAKKHELYHLWKPSPCCRCTPDKIRRLNIIKYDSWHSLFYICPSTLCRSSDSTCCCRYEARPNISITEVDVFMAMVLVQNIAPLVDDERKWVSKLYVFRSRLEHRNPPCLSELEFQTQWNKASKYLKKLTSSYMPADDLEERIQNILTEVIDASTVKSQLEQLKPVMDKFDEGIERVIEKMDDLRFEAQDRNRKLKRLIDLTENRLEKSKGSYVRIQRLMKLILRHFRDSRVIVLCGNSGTGKSWTAEEVVRHFSKETEGEYTPMISDKAKNLELVFQDGGKFVVLIDDPFGDSCFDPIKFSGWQPHFKTIEGETFKDNMICVICIRKSILNECICTLRKYELFHEDNIFDLSSEENRLNEEEKLSYFKQYCQRYRVKECTHVQNENLCLPKASSRAIHSSNAHIASATITSIAKSDPFIGYQQACYLFFNKRSFFSMGLDFFKRAGEELLGEIEKLVRSETRLQYIVLVYMLLNGGSIDLNNLNMTLLDSLLTLFKMRNVKERDIKVCIKNDIPPTYLKEMDRGQFCFSHASIQECVLRSFCDIHPTEYLEYATDNIITEFARPHTYTAQSGEICITLPEHTHERLAERLTSVFGMTGIAEHTTTEDGCFVSLLLDTIERGDLAGTKRDADTSNLEKHIPMVLIIDADLQAVDREEKIMNLALYQAVQFDRVHLVVEMLKRYSEKRLEANRHPASDDTTSHRTEKRKGLHIIFYLDALNYLSGKENVDEIFEKIGVSCVDLKESIDQLASLPSLKERNMESIFYIAERRWTHLLLSLSEKSGENILDARARDVKGLSFIHYCCKFDLVSVLKRITELYGKTMVCSNIESIQPIPEDERGREHPTPLVYAAIHGSKESVLYFLEQNANLMSANTNGEYLVHICCRHNWTDVLDKMVEMNTEVLRQRDSNNLTPVLYAAVKGYKSIVQFLLTYNVDTRDVDQQGNTLIHICIQLAWSDVIKQLVEKDKTILNLRNKAGETPVIYAATREDKAIVSYLLELGPDVALADGEGNNLLHHLCKLNWIDVVQKILDGEDFGEIKTELLIKTNVARSTPIVYAATQKHRDLVKYLLPFKVGIAVPDYNGDYLIHHCCKHNWSEIVKLIVEQNKDELNRTNKKNITPIIHASLFRSKAVIEVLIEKGADARINKDMAIPVHEGSTFAHYCCDLGFIPLILFILKGNTDLLNRQNLDGQTPILYAASKGERNTVEALVLLKPKISVSDNEGNTLMHYCCEYEWIDLLLFISIIAMDGDLLNQKNSNNASPVVHAAKIGKIAAVKCLVQLNADVDIPDDEGNCLLHYCCEKDFHDVIEMVTRKSQKTINHVNLKGNRPILRAASCGNKDSVLMMLLRGADVSFPDEFGKYLVDYCRENNWHKFVQILSKDVN